MDLRAVLDAMYQGRTLVMGHRGASRYAPMNTLPAFELAAQLGADGIELDVHRSKDGHAVIVHDFTVDKTTDGVGRVADLTLAELKALDAGGWFGPEFKGTQIPTLDEVFEAVGKRLIINVEIKSDSVETDGVEKVVADCIARHGLAHRVIVSSFNPYTLRRYREIDPTVPIGLLYVPGMPEENPFSTQEIRATLPHEAHHPYHEGIDDTLMALAKASGYRVNTWTVNDPERAVELRDLGVDAIITDVPDVILRALGR